MSEQARRWSLETARALLPEVRARTERAVAVFEDLDAQRKARAAEVDGDGELALAAQAELARVETRLRSCISRWLREMEALGLDVKGAWLVDFDNGSGCYCWRWPETELSYFHGYDEGFAERVRIQ